MINLPIATLKLMIKHGVNRVVKEKDHLNALNVFPVPDGDTGTNLSITLANAYENIENKSFVDIEEFGREFSRALLMNARGNSGVIFSQIIKGFVSTFKTQQQDVSLADFVESFSEAQKKAYKVVANPIEGTILTVIRLTANALQQKKGTFQTIESVMKEACKASLAALKETPNMLQELKEAGVVDSGGYGLCCFFDGMLSALQGNKIEDDKEELNINKLSFKPQSIISNALNDDNNDFGYCCEYILLLGARVSADQPTKEKFNLANFKNDLSKHGNSLVVIKEHDMVKVHVHTQSPHLILYPAKKYGEFYRVKIENMTQQFLENNPGSSLDTRPLPASRTINEVRVVATVSSEALAKIYKDDLFIKQTVDVDVNGAPSIQQFFNLIKNTASTNVIIVIDDSNLIMAATEACKLAPKDINTEIINVHNSVNSYLVCEAYDPMANMKKNLQTMWKTLKSISSGSLSQAIKDVKYSHISVTKGHYIGIYDKKIVAANFDTLVAAKALIDHLYKMDKKARNATIILGKNALQTNNNAIRKYLTERYRIKVRFIQGLQSIFMYHIALTK
ncbi:MAG: DAK2 domain-containing protein [Mycoplasmataceae bacterium]|nr:DAK2 domain-containing protein [Mycoplasmataceae bacterium]